MMKRNDYFKVAAIIFILYAIIIYHLFWVNLGKYGFNTNNLLTLIIVIIVAIIAFKLVNSSFLSKKSSIQMSILYSLPLVLTVMFYLVELSSGNEIEDVPVIILNLVPWMSNLIISVISIFSKD